MPGSAESVAHFDDAARIFKALSHPLRLRLVCGLCREASTLSRIAADLGVPVSTLALHLGVLRRCSILAEEKRGAEVVFRVREERVRRLLRTLCGTGAGRSPEDWSWRSLASGLPSRQ